ncbi:MAG: alpha-glucan family phosphorylase [Chloroflexota bacterium]|nr:alpha-glucan family phosphorylase [Chloroflexota bacterium]
MSMTSELPERIIRLDEIANNMWWSWNRQARDLFRELDYPLWQAAGHNPVKQLREIDPARLQVAAEDLTFLSMYDSIVAFLDGYMSSRETWYRLTYPEILPGPVAYFSMEFAFHNSLPIYAGGLGVLAGDLCKEASDLGIPLVGVGFMYPQGYFHQRISPTGWQEEVYRTLDFAQAPICPVYTPEGNRMVVSVTLEDTSLYVAIWKLQVGRTTVYLLDTDIEENAPKDRVLSARLYTADRRMRLRQEILLGVGGVRVLRALGIQPVVWHANEGHTSFMMVERAREEIEKGATFNEALARIRATSIFTTHTPVSAGHDVFPSQLVGRYFNSYCESIGLSSDVLLQLGQHGDPALQTFNMSVLGLRMASYCNAVSQVHGQVTRRMWHSLWPDCSEDDVPIVHVTNGVHIPTWVAPEISGLFEKYVAWDWDWDWIGRQDDPDVWQRLSHIPNDEIWLVRLNLKRKLLRIMRERAQERWVENDVPAWQVLSMGCLLSPEVLTIGFVRRFAEYKRPSLIFRDIERIKRIVRNPDRPVQIIFAGKSHPADLPSKHILQQVCSMATDRGFQGRIAFVEDYDVHLARFLVHGVDVWLNTPRRLQEASGTSGMKAALNGVINLSVCDGWWCEGFNHSNGWCINDNIEILGPDEEDNIDAEAIYRLLEDEVAPLYYDQDRSGVPHKWVAMIKESMRFIIPRFCARRMMKEYFEQMYLPAAESIIGERLV